MEAFGEKREYLILETVINEMTLKVPVDMAEEVGVRPPVSADELEDLVAVLAKPDPRVPSNWSRRFKNHQEKLKSGDVYQVAEVVRNLAARNRDASLSAAERTMYERARVNLISEISPALKVSPRRPRPTSTTPSPRACSSRRRPPRNRACRVRASPPSSPPPASFGARPPDRRGNVCQTRRMARVAFLGLGVMGGPMAGHLASAGHEVTVYNRTATKSLEWVARTATARRRHRGEAVEGAEFVMMCVGNDHDVREVVQRRRRASRRCSPARPWSTTRPPRRRSPASSPRRAPSAASVSSTRRSRAGRPVPRTASSP